MLSSFQNCMADPYVQYHFSVTQMEKLNCKNAICSLETDNKVLMVTIVTMYYKEHAGHFLLISSRLQRIRFVPGAVLSDGLCRITCVP